MRRALLDLGPLALAAATFAAARAFPDVTDGWYVHTAYPALAALVGAPAAAWRALVGGHTGPSLSELLVVLVTLLCVVRGVQRFRRARGLARALAPIGHVLRWGGVLVLLFVVLWGANHARRPLLASLGWAAPRATTEALVEVVQDLARVAEGARGSLSEGADGVVLAPTDWPDRAGRAFTRAAERRELLRGPAGPVVVPLASPLLVAARISGVFSPFTGEAHVVGDLPAVTLGFTACHELAHRRGFAREDEANALAFLVGIESGDDYLVHNAAAMGAAHALGALRVVDPERWLALVSELPPGLARDLDALRRYWAREQSALGRSFGHLATATNHAYLRSMGTHDGVHSYGRMLDLVLAWRALARDAGIESGHAPDPGAPPRDPAAREPAAGR